MDPKRGRGAVMSLALYTMMILALLALVTFGSRLYAGLTQNRQGNEGVRASLSTLVTALRASDAEGAVSLKEGPEGTALCLRQEDTGYESRIFLYQGGLYQQLCPQEDPFDTESAQLLAYTDRFEAEPEGGMLRLTTGEGTAWVALRCEGGEGVG